MLHLAPESAVLALTVHTVTSCPTLTVYEVVFAENAGERLPAETFRLARLALPETDVEAFFTVTVVLLAEHDTVSKL